MNRSEMKRTRKRPDLRGHFRVKIWIHVQEKSVQPRFQIRSVTIKSWKIRKLLGNHLRASKSNSLYPYIQFPVKHRILTITKMFESLTENRTICEKSLFQFPPKSDYFDRKRATIYIRLQSFSIDRRLSTVFFKNIRYFGQIGRFRAIWQNRLFWSKMVVFGVSQKYSSYPLLIGYRLSTAF